MLWLHTKAPRVFQQNNHKLAPSLNFVSAQDKFLQFDTTSFSLKSLILAVD